MNKLKNKQYIRLHRQTGLYLFLFVTALTTVPIKRAAIIPSSNIEAIMFICLPRGISENTVPADNFHTRFSISSIMTTVLPAIDPITAFLFFTANPLPFLTQIPIISVCCFDPVLLQEIIK